MFNATSTRKSQYLIAFIFQKYFMYLNSVLIVYDSSGASSLQLAYLDGITKSIATSSPVAVSWMDISNLDVGSYYEILLMNAELGTQGYITLVHNTSKFISMKYNATQNSILRQMDQLFLFLIDNENAEDTLKCDLSLYPNHIVMTANTSCHILWTQTYNSKKNNVKSTLIDTFCSEKSVSDLKTLFVNKLRNLNGQFLRVSSITYLPYVLSNFAKSGEGNVEGLNNRTKNVFYSGTEALIIIEFCRLRNCTLKVMPYGFDNWGGVYENGTSDGMIGAIYRREVELGIGCIYNWYNEIFDTSQYILKSAVTLLTPSPSPYPPYLTSTLPFTPTLWIFVMITIFVGSIVNYYLKVLLVRFEIDNIIRINRKSFILSCIEIATIFFQPSFVREKLNNKSVRIFVGSFFLAGIILQNSYSGGLKSILTVPKFVDPIDTVVKFAKSNFKWGAPASAWILTITESENPIEQILVQNFEIRTYAELRSLTFSEQYGFGIERLNCGGFTFGPYIKRDALKYLIILKDDVFFDYTRAIAIRGWPLMESFNEIIMQTLEHGLIIAWENKFVREYLDSKAEGILVGLASGHFEKMSPKILNMKHVSGHFLVLVIGLITASIVFVSEIVTYKIGKLY